MTYHHLEPIIGLEIHVQLKTATKLFSSVDNHAEGAASNTLISAIDVGHPGTLPSLNREALRFAVRIGLALGCRINSPTYFDRKHYIYPDLPKGYQISQFDVPVAEDGVITIQIPEGPRTKAIIHIERAHLEEDAAKNVHRDGKTLVDFNRAGTPLVEIVTRPDFRTPNEAKIFLLELRRILRYLAVSDADMEKGHLRCDANVSLRPVDANGLPVADPYYPKTEVKNMNSFKAVERALLFEIDRQGTLWQQGNPPMVTTTRGWDAVGNKTDLQRTKEEAADYRFMREPDIPPTDLSTYIQEETGSRPELPQQRRERFQSEYTFSEQAAATLTDDPALADFTERVISELFAWLAANPDIDADENTVADRYRQPIGKLVATWIGTKLLGALTERSEDIRTTHVTPENMAELLNIIYQKTITAQQATHVLEAMLDDGASPAQVIESLGLTTISDTDALGAIID
ncbi:TPA: Asp-tRNA(Asn)/Glu-tRNA(Gln) amidotransferase GatCAB subunit B [Candidatus Uhrbacteria bacterium]|nr:Asp-tRNA(Asn)/Glu-tRNA(Gln) amidotransferase GatCAB subunit B [Candidatus Uhrbacteria bacterium]